MSDSLQQHESSEESMEPGLEFLAPKFETEEFPWAQIMGYVFSLVLTFAALLLVINHAMAPTLLLAVIIVLALGQAGLQLGVFMHLRESRGPAWQLLPLALAFFIAFGLIGTSYWIMLFKTGVS